MKSRLSLLSCILLVPGSAGTDSQTKPPSDQLEFVQLTDSHISDDGWKAQGAEPYKQAMDDRAALHWAVDEVNKLIADKTTIDFVVYTGDFGLQNVNFSDTKCGGVAFKSETGLPPFASEMAADELALELNRLKVSDFYVVPGNNDIIEEKVVDGVRFECFISQLKISLQKLTSQMRVQVLYPDTAVQAGRFRLAGLNTASFKSAEENYDQFCQQTSLPQSLLSVLRRGCPLPQFRSLESLLSSDSSPLILFTHIPDLVDPYLKELNPSRTQSTWDINQDTRKIWKGLASKTQVVGIFAGHFHSSKKVIYGTNAGTAELFVPGGIGEKIWVAPPLAGKNQRDGKPQARGFMLVKVGESHGAWQVDASPFWYLIENAQKEGIPMSPLASFGLTLLVILIAGCFGGTLNFLRKDSKPLTLYDWLSDLLWGVGAAVLVPLFLSIIGSNLVSDMHNSAHPEAGPDYSKVLVFGGFCLIAAMSAKAFIISISDRALRQVESAEKKADRAERQASQVQTIVEYLVEPTDSKASAKAVETFATSLTEVERKLLHALADNTKYVLRTVSGLAAETKIEETNKVLKELQSKKLIATIDYSSSGRQEREYWYITPEGRAALTASQSKDLKPS